MPPGAGTSAFILPSCGEQWSSIYKNRTACERVNNRILNDYHLYDMKTHTKSGILFPVANRYKHSFRCRAKEAASANRSIIQKWLTILLQACSQGGIKIKLSTYLINTISGMTESFSSAIYTFPCNPRLYSLFIQEFQRLLIY